MPPERKFNRFAGRTYDPIKIASIDGTDTEPHDRAVVRAINSKYTPNKSLRGDPRNTLFVGRLNPRTTEDTLLAEFGVHGRILKCRIVRDIVTGNSKQYAFIEYDNANNAQKAYDKMDKEYIDGAEIIVDWEVGRLMRGWKPRRLGGGFGGKKESGQLRFGCRDRPFWEPLPLIAETNTKKDFNRQKKK
ncbi:U11/U12 small nuclear ribonucleoprotein 35 kDa protein [Manduca sexta]|uniref:U11/U12 small nuclear ribonucleoprotein 35 kDa protein n=1 Tax=Manduca sexta TaxID=7130 RepID=UPI001183147D|nr:U11/U12 small nuclear ribonucleoprotein 35 kDa protein [Manduca sexta]